jgi:hypothetical protein
MIRRIAFLGGLILGSGLFAWGFGSAMTFLFTGKLPTLQLDRERLLRVQLVDVHTLYEAPSLVPRRPAEKGEG